MNLLKRNKNMENTITITPVGIIHNENDFSTIEIFDEYKDALLGLEGFSHIIILAWFHKNDTKDKIASSIGFYGDIDGMVILIFPKDIAKKACELLIGERVRVFGF